MHLADHLSLLEDDAVMVPRDKEEKEIICVFILSLTAGINALTCNYAVVRDYCKKNGLDRIEVFRVCKAMENEQNTT